MSGTLRRTTVRVKPNPVAVTCHRRRIAIPEHAVPRAGPAEVGLDREIRGERDEFHHEADVGAEGYRRTAATTMFDTPAVGD